MFIIIVPRRWRRNMGAGRLWHMVGGATSGRYNARPMCHISKSESIFGTAPTNIVQMGAEILQQI